MQLHRRLLNSMFGKAVLAAAVLSGLLLFAGAPSAKANEWDDCNRRAAYSDWRFRVSVEHFGYYSPQAAYWRHERFEASERMERYRRQDWREHDGREHRRDNDDHRYYRDRDRD